jgi:ESS family glutamate:Na+ symporter
MSLEQSFMPLLIAFAWMSGMLLIGTFFRAKIKLFQKFLFPSCLIGGVFGFIFMSMGWIEIHHETFMLIAFHLFSLGFVSIGLTGGNGKEVGKTIFKGSLWMALAWTASLSIQSITGAGIIFGLNQFFDPIFEGLGFLVGHGYTQGPGQTLAIASVWQKSFHVPDVVTIGLTFAAIGFFVAAFIGVPLANWGVRKGFATNTPEDLPDDFITGILSTSRKESVILLLWASPTG